LNKTFYDNSLNLFEELFDCNLEITTFPTTAEMLNNIENSADSIDVFIGIDNTIFAEIDSFFIEITPNNKKYLNDKLIFAKKIVPVYFSPMAFIYEKESFEEEPASFGIIQDGKFKKQIVLTHPETCSIGRATLIWSVATFGKNGYRHFWRSIKENVTRTVANYDAAFNMLLASEATVMCGYQSVLFTENECFDKDRFGALVPAEGEFNLIFGSGISRNSKNMEIAKRFIDFLISNEFQQMIDGETAMFPVNVNVKLPAEFIEITKPKKDFTRTLKQTQLKNDFSVWLNNWKRIITNNE
ncbi:MAG: thiamine ABC transporter substrate-binding protein, partial [Candidatus Cloacimonetes bacterium]|nr:thiamine ABC transporter substrate-binding protein [Candidatus Cloacimonadota bacterium]